MAKGRHKSPHKEKPKLIVRLLIPMLLLSLLQLFTFFVILTAGGEFSSVRQYAYNTLVDKTANRRNSIQNDFLLKTRSVLGTAERINDLVERVMEEHGASAADMKTDKELNRIVMEASVDDLVDLLRRSKANDAYLILDTGGLYQLEGSCREAKSALYLRDLDPTTDTGFDDLLMEMGLSSISKKHGIILDSGWSLYFEGDPNDMENYGFYYTTMRTAQEFNTLPAASLGHWSGFSNVFKSTSSSMKYSVPLIAYDGTVYGVIGIGMTENSVIASMPVSDFTNETACYILGCDMDAQDSFSIVTHSGPAFSRLVGNVKKLAIGKELDDDVYDFRTSASERLAGAIEPLTLYTNTSPYYQEQWALISVADRASVLRPLANLVQMLLISALLAFAICIVVVVIVSRRLVKPITDAIVTMQTNREYNRVIRFKASNIYELDEMTDAITQLQINVQDFSSQVSKMIRIADVGLGTFMYDRTNDSVFVGQSLLRLLEHDFPDEEDVLMSREAFLESIIAEETRTAVSESLKQVTEDTRTEDSREYSITGGDGEMLWMRLSIVNNTNKSIGILQDITAAVMERKRIEFERDYDSTTGLLNRHAYQIRLEELFRNPEALQVTAFLMIDLDNLKYVNDTYGHDFGDDYIKTAAAALKNFHRYGGIVSRLSGDEFNVCLSGFSSKEEVRRIIDEVRGQLLQSYCMLADGTHFKVRASAGVSWYPDDARSYEQLMKYADFAMYTIKHSTKGEIAEFDSSAYEKDSVLITGVEEMNRIIDECSVRYAFHSIVSARTGEIYGYEALMRPQSAILKSPMELLRIARTGAKLYEIERLTWTKALDDFQKQIDAGHIAPDSHVFINSISNCVLESADVEKIEEAHTKLLSQVVLEILESENVIEEYNVRKSKRMQMWNAQIALDDFGTGYNSEFALITMHPNIVKIDRSIISGCDKDISRRTIINNLVRLVKQKQALVLAEGVETEEELRTVISCGVDLLQGYYICRPVFEPQPVPQEVAETIRRFAKNESKKKRR